MSIISSGRVLPCDLNDSTQTKYLVIRGSIQNNERHPITEEWDAPVLNGCPAPFPKKGTSSVYCPDGTNCEIRLHPVDLTAPPICDPSDPSENGSTYFLPSLALLIKNNVNVTQKIIDPYDASEWLTGSPDTYPPMSHLKVKCDGTTKTKSVPFRQDGILSAVYTISLFNQYKSCLGKSVYEYVICPYTPADVFTLSSSGCLEPSDVHNVKDIMGTQPFCLGSKEQPCVCVSLLLHGALRDDEDPSQLDCPETDLYWVGVKLYYTNYEGKMCYKNPVCLNITKAPDSALKDFFTPWFAKVTTVVTTVPGSVVSPVCNQLSSTCGQVVEKNITPGQGSLQGKVYLGCGILGKEIVNHCDTIKNSIVKVSTKIDINDIIYDTQNCNNYIVLLPNTVDALP